MEKRKTIGLKGYFSRTLLLFFLGILGILALAFLTILLCMELGITAPANAGEIEARQEIVRQSESGVFTRDLTPQFYDYIYFDPSGNIAASSLDGPALSTEISRYALDNISYGTGIYVFYEDGSRCLFTWRYVVSFTNPALQSLVPNVELLMLIIAGFASILFFLMFVRGMGRKLGDKLALVEAASDQIAQQNLDTRIDTFTGIQEFNHALKSMDKMRITLKDALIKQWESEQQRKQEIAALAHDIKTPLTIVNGNAELLLEDRLPQEQAKLVDAIHTAGLRAQQYVGALQQVTNLDVDSEQSEPISVAKLLDELNAALSPLAKQKRITLDYVHGNALHPITVFPMMLTRALINIGENAIRFTHPDGKITLSVCQNETETLFRIQDQGPGFSISAILHAKEMFWQQEKSRTDHHNYGIGLSIADKVAKKHAGRLLLENTSQGGCVTLTIQTGALH